MIVDYVQVLKGPLKGSRLRTSLFWLTFAIMILTAVNNLFNIENCSGGDGEDRDYFGNRDATQQSPSKIETFASKNRQTPLIFVGGVPRSGTTLMRAMLDAHPLIRCGEETRIIPRLIYMRGQWANSKKENERLVNAGITDDLIDSAMGAFILETIVRHGKPAENLCNKDPLVLRYSIYMKKVFPQSKYILMIRDGRATVHSIISRKVTITGFNLNSYRDCLTKWSSMIEQMYIQCLSVGPESCMPVYYEQLILHPEKIMRSVLSFLNITWHEAVLQHEKFIGDEISLSKNERSSDQVIKPVNLEALNSWVGKIPFDVVQQMDKVAPMLRRLGYDPNANPPKYGEPDGKIKENTLNIQENKDYWQKQAQKFSIHVNNTNLFNRL
jgi:protein-tyrosine sulfotransferase